MIDLSLGFPARIEEAYLRSIEATQCEDAVRHHVNRGFVIVRFDFRRSTVGQDRFAAHRTSDRAAEVVQNSDARFIHVNGNSHCSSI